MSSIRRNPARVMLVLACSACQQEPSEPWLPWSRAESRLLLNKSRVLELPDVGYITDLRLDGETWIVAGTTGVTRTHFEEPKILSRSKYALSSSPHLDCRIVDIDGDGCLEIARFNAGWVPPTCVLELDGRMRWTQELPAREDDLLDSDGDGRLEILVGNPNEVDVYLLDDLGRVRWKQAWGPTQNGVVALDTDGDGAREILYSDGEGVRICNAAGERLRALETPRNGFVNSLEELQGLPGLERTRVIVGAYVEGAGQQWWCYSQRLEYLGPLDWFLADALVDRMPLERQPPMSVSVFEEKDQAPVAGFSASRLQILLFDAAGKSVFEDVLEPEGEALAHGRGGFLVMSSKPLRLVVGYGKTLWEYRE